MTSKTIVVTNKPLLALLAGVLLTACAGAAIEIGEPTLFTSADFGFSLEHPSNWLPAVDPANLVGSEPDRVHAVAFASQTANAIFVVYVQDLEDAPTLAEYAAQQVDNIRSTAGETIFSDPVPAQLGGQDAMLTQATAEQNGQRLTQRTLLAIRGGRGYALSLVAPDDPKLNAALDAMLASFKFAP